ncbi:MAG TPA: hypothetical protein VNO22_07345, partial [Planctomycetota bacterium]|nr:hypothetical protein [Planctomycetota bacterium]
PDSLQTLRLQVEVRPAGSPFTGTPTAESNPAPPGSFLQVAVTELPAGPHHWQARVVDALGVAGPWSSFGANADPSDPDFVVSLPSPNAAPAAPAFLGQFRSGGLFPIPVGGTAREPAVAFKARLSDPEGGPVRLEVEIQPVGASFTGIPTATGPYAPGGSETSLTVPNLPDGLYFWQARAADAAGAVSPWVPFGANADVTDADFIVNTSSNAPPSAPAPLSQHATPTGAPEPVGFIDFDGTLVFRAVPSDSDPLQTLRIQIEIQPVGQPFTGIPTASSSPVPSGSPAEILVAGLADGDYHWQARAVDTAGAASPWASFGANADTEPDFSVVLGVDLGPAAPSSLGVFRGDATTAIPSGGTTPEPQVLIKATSSDPESGPWRLEIEIRPIGVPLSGVPTASSLPAPSGAEASVLLAGLPDGSYHGQARAVDAAGNASAWVPIGTNPDGATDFSVDTSTNAAPAVSDLAQLRAAGGPAIPHGGTTNEAAVLLRATVNSADPGQRVRLRVEVQPEGVPFTGIPTASSAWVPSGTPAQTLVEGLSEGVSYRWQAWAEDTSGAASPPEFFGPSDPDFTRSSNAAPSEPLAANQYLLNGITPIPVGGTTNQTGAVFAATLEDLEGDALRLQIEIQPIGTPFAGAPSATSDPVASAGRATVSLGGFPDLQGYHWQARTLDSSGRPSPWIPFGANPETEPDFRVERASPGILPGGGGGARPADDKKAGYCSASTAAPTSLPSAALLLAFALGSIPLLRRR